MQQENTSTNICKDLKMFEQIKQNVHNAINALKQGKCVVVIDDYDR